jgi:hypothetical protein
MARVPEVRDDTQGTEEMFAALVRQAARLIVAEALEAQAAQGPGRATTTRMAPTDAATVPSLITYPVGLRLFPDDCDAASAG